MFNRETHRGTTTPCSWAYKRCAVRVILWMTKNGSRSSVVDENLQDAVNAASWTDQIATSLSKCTPKLQSELLGKTFMSYSIEWCRETREASCAFVADKTTWLFDDSLHKIRSVQPSPLNNVYMYITWSLTDFRVISV